MEIAWSASGTKFRPTPIRYAPSSVCGAEEAACKMARPSRGTSIAASTNSARMSRRRRLLPWRPYMSSAASRRTSISALPAVPCPLMEGDAGLWECRIMTSFGFKWGGLCQANSGGGRQLGAGRCDRDGPGRAGRLRRAIGVSPGTEAVASHLVTASSATVISTAGRAGPARRSQWIRRSGRSRRSATTPRCPGDGGAAEEAGQMAAAAVDHGAAAAGSARPPAAARLVPEDRHSRSSGPRVRWRLRPMTWRAAATVSMSRSRPQVAVSVTPGLGI
jgi:hypothetical protein